VRPDDGETEAGQEGKVEAGRVPVEALRDQGRYRNEHLDTPREVLEEHRRLLASLIEMAPELEASAEPTASSQRRRACSGACGDRS